MKRVERERDRNTSDALKSQWLARVCVNHSLHVYALAGVKILHASNNEREGATSLCRVEGRDEEKRKVRGERRRENSQKRKKKGRHQVRK